ncbi:cysteine proteinase [Rickenella mellea]|uniref:Cysteine proteinase n=1 Tax=Rickenella mellea TaxID=50990 RepID=A0A4Y7QME5_9AGAM|nr:cysteine proteinase [Rickenella mellea]
MSVFSNFSKTTIDVFLERAIQKARKTFESPKPPKPFLPNIDQLKLSIRTRNEEIDRRLHPKRPSLPSALPPDAKAEADRFLQKQGIVSKLEKEQVTNRDLDRLRPGQWLNDELINFYGQMILSRSIEADAAKENGKTYLNVHYFSTFFWPKLQTGYEKSRLAKWTKKVDIFLKDIVLIPINHGNAHWTMSAINFRCKRIESYDSMLLDRSQVYKSLRMYLDEEHKNKKKKPFDFTGWEDYELEDTPEQENGFDCGVFTCQFMESLSRGEESFGFTQRDMPYLRQRMIWEIGHARLWDTS